MEKSPYNLNLLHCRQNHNLFMKRNERENKENAVRLIVHSITHRGEIWRGGGAWSEEMAGGGGGSFVSTYKRDGWDGMTIHKFSNSYYIKKGLLLTVIRIRGIAETRRCGAVAVRSQVITWSSALTLYALYLSRPLPPLPSHQLRPFFLRLGRLSPPLFTLTRGIQGCPKTISFDKTPGIQLLKNLSNPLFLCRLAPVHFYNTFCRKMLSLLHYSITRKSFPDLSFVAVFSPFLNECQLFMPKDFLEPPCLTLLGVSLVLWKRGRGETDNERITPILLPLVPEFTNIWISHLQFLHF